MRILTILATLIFVPSVFAAECVDKSGKDIFDQPDVFTELIENASSCYEASTLARACAYGSGLDVYTAQAAYGVCESDLATRSPSEKAKSVLTDMQGLCIAKYSPQEGSLYRSLLAYCVLDAINWVVQATGGVDQ